MATPVASSSKQPAKIQLTVDLLAQLKPAKVFQDALDKSAAGKGGSSPSSSTSTPQITSLAFDDLGEKLLSAGEDEGFVIWDTKKGRKLKNFLSKKYGVALARFTHKGNIIHASTKGDDHTIRYQSPHDNKYLAYFRGHTARVRSIHMNPINDEFISAGDDGSVRVWDTRTTNTQAIGVLNDVGGSCIAAWDNTGVCYAVAVTEQQSIQLYDRTTMDSGPFSNAALIDYELNSISYPPPRPTFTSISFSNNGDYILVGTSGDAHYLLDAFSLNVLRRLVGFQSLGKSSGEEVSFTANSRFVLSGSADGCICVWDLGETKIEEGGAKPDPSDSRRGKPATTMTPTCVIRAGGDEEAKGISRAVRFNPRLCMMAVGGEELSMWLKEKDEEEKIAQGW